MMESINKAKVCSLKINEIDKLLVKIDKNKFKGGKEEKKQKKKAAWINTGFEKDKHATEIKKKRGYYEHFVNTSNTLDEMED